MSEADAAPDFIREIVAADLRSGKHAQIATRFPPHPNGYLHIGHAKSICLNFGLAAEYGGTCNLRFDDTNPEAEDPEFVESIQEDIRWLGFDFEDRLFFASDYFEQLYGWAIELIEKGLAYVDSSSEEEIRARRGNYYNPGVDSPHRDRPIEESLDLFRRMRAGEFAEGSQVLRAKLDMQSPDLNLRDPLMYRILKTSHHRTGTEWSVYPMYDWAHGQCDAIEGITHSVCTLEFEDHRPLYEWFLGVIDAPSRPQQIEFARLKFNYTVLSKRRLQKLVENGDVDGWDDPRMPTLRALRRRGFPAEAIRGFCDRLGVTKRDSIIDIGQLEHAIRDYLNTSAPRAMCVLHPLRVVIQDFEADRVEWLEVPTHPYDPSLGSRRVPLTRELWVERDDFLEDPPKKWHRLAPGREVRLRSACLITCQDVVKDASGEVTELRCSWDPESLGGAAPDGRRVRGTLHWVSAAHAAEVEVRLYDRLFLAENPLAGELDFREHLNPESLEVLTSCRAEPELARAAPGARFQFERLGYFCADPSISTPGRPVFNRTVSLRDTWAKLKGRAEPRSPR